VRAAGLAALAWHIDGRGVVPVAQIENLPIARATQLVEGSSSKIRGIHGAAIAGAREGAAIEEGFGASRNVAERMLELNAVWISPGPVPGIGAEPGRELLVGRLKCLKQESVARAIRILAEDRSARMRELLQNFG
jgi:hypothetical protein